MGSFRQLVAFGQIVSSSVHADDTRPISAYPHFSDDLRSHLPDGLCPSDRMTTPSSAIVMVPSSSLSNSMNASLNSETRSRDFC